MGVRIPNSTQADSPPSPPARADGQPYEYELIHDGFRAYGDTFEELAGLLIDGYDDLGTGEERFEARLRYAADIQVPLQADFAASGNLAACSEDEHAVLLGARDRPPEVAAWQAPVPLVLVSAFYAPAGELPRPQAAAGSEIIWIDPRTAESLLRSLHAVGWIIMSARSGSEPKAG
jgi:hypothetical protein